MNTDKIRPVCVSECVATLSNQKLWVEDRPLGTALYQPTHQLREVVEIVTPEIPGGPVEPYVGLCWDWSVFSAVVVNVCPEAGVLIANNCNSGLWGFRRISKEELWYSIISYPRTPSTPAVTRTVRKWVPLTPEEIEQVQWEEGAPVDDGWIPWNGGECPVSGDTYTLRRYRTGEDGPRAKAKWYEWCHPATNNTNSNDIIAYKVVP